ncbi:MAG: 3-oxoacyl-acyl-carrier-protein synthase III [Fusobacteria bacterium]|nr:MAG: 3-oxoacyl-acyl-carrier-protein synthase III [Fusobacteriota bacterium]KAF0228928.1 MAG: 3-oxoacyl-acyl-carrier-protein synthase [Fusobacteriota bacterium]
MYGKIIGTGFYVPDNKVPNEFFESIMETNDEWISSRTGIKSRYFSKGENTSDLGTKAAEIALADSGLSPEDLDIIIFATMTPDTFMPSTACLVQKKIGAVNAFAFDISAACSGFMYALAVAKEFLENGKVKNALVIGGEVMSKALDFTDRGTAVLFGDGAGAVVLQRSEEPGIINSYLGSRDDVKGSLVLKALPVDNPFVSNENDTNKMTMDGREVFKFSKQVIMDTIDKVLEGTGYNYDDIKMIIPHQANTRLIDYAIDKNDKLKDKFYINVDRFGNTSAGSIAIALSEVRQKKLVEAGDLVILVGFGGGFTWGSLLIKM